MYNPNYPDPSTTAANFSVTRAENGAVVSGLITVCAPRGAIYEQKFDAQGNPLLIPANGKRGFHLERDIVNRVPLEDVVFLRDFVHPALNNTTVSARKVEEAQAEDADLVLLSGTGAISAATPLDTPLSTFQGKYYLQQDGDELLGYLRGIIPPAGSGAFRIVVEEVG